MNKTLSGTLTVLCVALAVVLLGTVSVAQDVYQVNYYANANIGYAPDATVYIDNPGYDPQPSAYRYPCAIVYVLTYDQEMAQSCGCSETTNDLNALSVDYDLTSNPL